MEENNFEEISETSEKKGCINCGELWVVPGYPNPLCQNCRDELTRFRMPNWVKIFAASVGLILLFSLYKIPRNILTGIQYEKAMTAMAEKKYLTAQTELQKVVTKAPKFIEAQSYLLISAFNNLDFETFGKTYEKIQDEKFEDMTLFNQLQNTIEKAGSYYGDDEIRKLEEEYDNDFSKIPDDTLQTFVTNHENAFAAMSYASRLADKKDYALCDSILNKIITYNPDYIPAYMSLASSKRQQDKFDESLKYCEHVLSLNKENLEAIASKSRTLLKSKKDKEALSLALTAFKRDEKNIYSICTLILAYHYSNKIKEEKELISRVAPLKDSATVQSLRYVLDVINGKEFFRN
jgi:tetratricopeptide (TPR) repeat protein